MRLIDDLLNKYTMYFVTLWVLRSLVGISVILSLAGILPYNPLNLIFSFCLLVAASFSFNKIFAGILKVPANKESYAITALILYLILLPVDSISSVVTLILASFLAMASKYFVTINRRHIFNPAAFSLVILDIIGSPQAQWWVGSKAMLPFVLIAGLLVVRKVRKFQMVFIFLIVGVLSFSAFSAINGADILKLLPQLITSWPILFMGTIMLVEPFTSPPRKNQQIFYGGLVGFLTGVQFQIGPIFNTSELALCIGNIFSYIVSFRKRVTLIFEEKREMAPGIFEFLFRPDKKFAFLPGQFMEWTFSHPNPDNRGVRRYFSLASSPTEETIRLGIRFDQEKGSSYKKNLMSLNIGDKLYAGSLAGDFVLPKDKTQKLAFIAGGIGITPFCSMIQYLIDQKEKRDIILLYACTNESDFVYRSTFEQAQKDIGMKLLYITKRLDSIQIKKEVPDYKERKFYLSGPKGMVDNNKSALTTIGVQPYKIVTDYFPGY